MVYKQQIYHKLESLTIWSRKKKGGGENIPPVAAPPLWFQWLSNAIHLGEAEATMFWKVIPEINICTGHVVLPLPTIPASPHTPSELSLTNKWSYLYLHLMKYTYELKNVTRWYLRYGQLQPTLCPICYCKLKMRGNAKSRKQHRFADLLRYITLSYLSSSTSNHLSFI